MFLPKMQNAESNHEGHEKNQKQGHSTEQQAMMLPNIKVLRVIEASIDFPRQT
jgi:hypothetical protein